MPVKKFMTVEKSLEIAYNKLRFSVEYDERVAADVIHDFAVNVLAEGRVNFPRRKDERKEQSPAI
jgi:hypothetical protein